MVEKGDLQGILGVLGSMVGAAVTWAAGLGVISILFSVTTGALLTYIVQKRTQTAAWKRESELRKIDDIYGRARISLSI